MPTTITFSVAGDYIIEDDGNPSNARSIIRLNGDDAIFGIVPHPADSLTILATVDGVNLTFNVTESFGSGTLTVGSLTNAAETPDNIVVKNIPSSSSVTLVADGAITEGGSDGSPDITANAIILSASTGIGTGANALETQTVQLEAEANTGGINIANFGNLQVGGFSADVDGLDVLTSGDIMLTNLGSIVLADETSFDSVHGGDASGNVALIANGYDSDISSNVDQSSIIAPRGNIVLTAGRDVSFGLAGADFGNDVRANGSITVNAGRDFLLSGFADFFADGVLGTTGGNLTVNAGRHISLLDDTGASASLAVLGSAGGDVILNAGPNGLVTLEPPSTNTISSGSGDVIVNADRLLIGATSGITAPGAVTLRPVTEGRDISLGSLSDGAAALELSDGELDRVFANTLVLGGPAAGTITVGAPIAPGSVTNFTLQSGSDILANFSLTAPNNLTLNAGDNVYQLAASTLTATNLGVLVGQVGGEGGTNLFLGTITAATTNVTGNLGSDSLNGTSGDNILDGGAGADTMAAGAGNDFYHVDDSADVITENAASGSDRALSTAPTYTIGANVEHITLLGTGNISGTGNSANNNIIGNSGDNLLRGLAGHDTLRGMAGNDTLEGNSHNDLLDGGTGADTMLGGNGHDTYVVDHAGDLVIEESQQGNDTAESGLAFYQLPSHVEQLVLTGSFGHDGLGNGLDNKLFGNGGKNLLNGLGGDDVIDGGAGKDSLYGHTGADMLTGGAGDDRFLFNTPVGGGNVDTITDYTVADDIIYLANYAFTAIGPNGTLSAAAFQLGTAALDATDRIIYDQATGDIRYDPDGNGAAAATLFAVVSDGTPLTNAEFFVYG